jgi:hypothetical protein
MAAQEAGSLFEDRHPGWSGWCLVIGAMVLAVGLASAFALRKRPPVFVS